ncbi:MAG: DUF1735 domain-containing protein [Prevotella sp.]|nr:DUF1735 domain-containing protein [Prevotella sp.]
MKTNIVKCFSYCMLAVAALSFVSCSSDDSYDVYGNPDNLVYAKANVANTFTTKVIHTPVGDMGEFKASFPVKILHASSGTSVSYELDQSLVDEYNKAKGTNYAALPADILDLTKAVAHIEADTVASKDSVHVAFAEGADLSKLTETAYVAPLRMKVTAGDGVASEERGVVYVIVNTSIELINDAATEVKGTAVEGMTCIEAVNLNKDAFSTSGWSFLQKSDNASFVVDLGETKNVGSILIASGMMNNAKLELSADNSSWTEVGNTSEHSGPQVGSGWYANTAYVLYGAVPARYVRVTMSLDTSYWGWNYIAWGYCTVDAFNVYAE